MLLCRALHSNNTFQGSVKITEDEGGKHCGMGYRHAHGQLHVVWRHDLNSDALILMFYSIWGRREGEVPPPPHTHTLSFKLPNSLTIPVVVVRLTSAVSLRNTKWRKASEEERTLSLCSTVQLSPSLSTLHQNLLYQPGVSSKYRGKLISLL